MNETLCFMCAGQGRTIIANRMTVCPHCGGKGVVGEREGRDPQTEFFKLFPVVKEKEEDRD